MKIKIPTTIVILLDNQKDLSIKQKESIYLFVSQFNLFSKGNNSIEFSQKELKKIFNGFENLKKYLPILKSLEIILDREKSYNYRKSKIITINPDFILTEENESWYTLTDNVLLKKKVTKDDQKINDEFLKSLLEYYSNDLDQIQNSLINNLKKVKAMKKNLGKSSSIEDIRRKSLERLNQPKKIESKEIKKIVVDQIKEVKIEEIIEQPKKIESIKKSNDPIIIKDLKYPTTNKTISNLIKEDFNQEIKIIGNVVINGKEDLKYNIISVDGDFDYTYSNLTKKTINKLPKYISGDLNLIGCSKDIKKSDIEYICRVDGKIETGEDE